MNPKNTKTICNALNRVAGPVRGVSQMVEEGRYCIDILHQIRAVKAALAKAETRILKAHAECCVEEAIQSGDATRQREKFNELVEVFAQAKL